MDQKTYVSNYERPYFYTRTPLAPPQPQPPSTTTRHRSHGFNLNYMVSPSVLLIIIVLATIVFLSGLLHILVRYFFKPINMDPDDFDNVTALEGQLQQLFHLHDSGVDQSFIDTLPVFSYKSVSGVKGPFDCAVCLCEFTSEDLLRLLPRCSHAFHMDCIDTWLLSHSTCPLCRSSLLSDFTPSSCSPIVLVLESGSVENSVEHSREIVDYDQPNSSTQRVSNEGFEFDKGDMVKGDDDKEKVVTIKLGKLKNVNSGEKQTIDGRRCFSMGSFEYVMNENSSLQVPIRTQVKKQASKKSSLPITPSHRPAMSECGGNSRRDFTGIELRGGGNGGDGGGNGKSKRDSFSVSKIWLRGKKEKANTTVGATIGPSSRGSFSFRFDGLKAETRTNSEMDIKRWDDEDQEASNPPSYARRSLFWIMGWHQIKLDHSLSPTHV